MSFSFGFHDDDISDDEVSSIQSTSVKDSPRKINPLDELSKSLDKAILPKLYKLESLLASLKDLRVSFETFITSKGTIVYRRELFDVKHQAMCDDEIDQTTNRILVGEDQSDLEKNSYEGGFKSWECSYDTIDYLAQPQRNIELSNYKAFLDLGCGTALPTSYIIAKLMGDSDSDSRTFVVSDFNYDVLRLVSLPNIIINWAATLSEEKLASLVNTQDGPRLAPNELIFTPGLLSFFQQELAVHNLRLDFVSGSWGREFMQLLTEKNIDFIITSETIYSNDTLPVVAQSIIEFLSARAGKALVAAKNIYFGVGGSVVEFLHFLSNNSPSHFNFVQTEIEDAKLKKSIVAITSSP